MLRQPALTSVVFGLAIVQLSTCLAAQDQAPSAEAVAQEVLSGEESGQVDVPQRVEVKPANSDQKIGDRLAEIMEATGWFESPRVRVDRGVVFLAGTADTKQHQAWAEATAMNTADVVAVVNQIKVADQALWNLAPAITSLKELSRDATGIFPLMIVALAIGFVSYVVAAMSARLTRWLVQNRIDSRLLRQVLGNFVGVLIFIIGIYIALRVSGLTRLAVTLLGGTGLVGLALGFAFRDIAENYLASILLSLNHPFRVGDLIEVDGAKGFVRKVTTRGTVLSTLEGNQVQMPNSTVYKGKITNFTATPLSRHDFTLGIGFEDSIVQAQDIIMDVLNQHAAVVQDPAPVVVVDSLGSATVNLLVLYWFDQTTHSPLKVSSSVIRQTKQRLTEAKITMPDEARELVFPQGVPVQLIDANHSPAKDSAGVTDSTGVTGSAAREPATSSGEGDLKAEQEEVLRATQDDQTLVDDANLIA